MKNVKNEPKSSSAIPLVIIVLVMIAVIGGGWWLYSSSRSSSRSAANRNTAANTDRGPQTPANAPAGAPLGANMLGSPNASVTVEEFADYQCGACAAAHPVMKEITSIYGPRIQFVFRHFPLSIPGHDKSYDAAVATEAAGMQGKFWAMQNELFVNQGMWTRNPDYRSIWEGYAQKIGLNVEQFKNDMLAMTTKARVDADIARARALGVNSTPTIYVNGRPVPFPDVNVTGLRQIIDAELQRASAPAQQPAASAPAASNANAQ